MSRPTRWTVFAVTMAVLVAGAMLITYRWPSAEVWSVGLVSAIYLIWFWIEWKRKTFE